LTDKLSAASKENLLKTLKERFKNNMHRHPEMIWEDVQEKLEKQPEKMWSLNEMEKTEGEPDVVGNAYVFIDCAKESPKGRRSVCYDRQALENRKKYQPDNDAKTMAQKMGIDLLTEEDYRTLQTYEAFDLKTSSWVETPTSIRELGGALFCDRRYKMVFVYHNSAESYYASRAFRGKLIFGEGNFKNEM